ncbi:Protein kinase-like domain containing protein [Parasponia andersonii]|uniref:Protein kinase-like domain containing protein n=1 Tax=Parasponia andersonii TaxID=3476 RepID=A0A2P5A528_PARAD|nr:Protein kinase-like domain containing protein [Parasponia andersonii]
MTIKSKLGQGFIKITNTEAQYLHSWSGKCSTQIFSFVNVLLFNRAHHKNLTTIVEYCYDETHNGLIYEYMAMGNLRSHLSVLSS